MVHINGLEINEEMILVLKLFCAFCHSALINRQILCMVKASKLNITRSVARTSFSYPKLYLKNYLLFFKTLKALFFIFHQFLSYLSKPSILSLEELRLVMKL